MCAIVDASVGYEVFIESSQSAAGKFFFDWLMRKNGGTLVAGGKLLCELNRIADFQRVFSERLQAGRARTDPRRGCGHRNRGYAITSNLPLQRRTRHRVGANQWSAPPLHKRQCSTGRLSGSPDHWRRQRASLHNGTVQEH